LVTLWVKVKMLACCNLFWVYGSIDWTKTKYRATRIKLKQVLWKN